MGFYSHNLPLSISLFLPKKEESKCPLTSKSSGMIFSAQLVNMLDYCSLRIATFRMEWILGQIGTLCFHIIPFKFLCRTSVCAAICSYKLNAIFLFFVLSK